MARVLVLFALLVLPALVTANLPTGRPFLIQGRVYCDTCRAGFETTVTTYISGAKVRVECKDRDSLQLTYSKEAETDSTGTYSILVEQDHEDHMCQCVLVSSPLEGCKVADPGRCQASAVLTRANGVVNSKHFVNAMGFLKDKPLAGCEQLLKTYFPTDEDE
ncbi:hypothetical protein UlMin_038225 [Ulmus minor]